VSAPDPIRELAEAVEAGAQPPVAWAMRWGSDGRDPVAAAWAASVDVEAMGTVLVLAERAVWERHATEVGTAIVLVLADGTRVPVYPDAGAEARRLAAAWLRDTVTPPTLADLLAARELQLRAS
jgi:hypothetical protein